MQIYGLKFHAVIHDSVGIFVRVFLKDKFMLIFYLTDVFFSALSPKLLLCVTRGL